VGLVAALLWLPGRFLRAPIRVTMTVLGVWGYVLLAGSRPSVRRAAVMATALLLCRLLQRPPATRNSLAVALMILLLVEPSLSVDLAFQLSVTATAGVLVLAPLILRWRRRRSSPVVRLLAVSVAAQLAAMPIALPATNEMVTAAMAR